MESNTNEIDWVCQAMHTLGQSNTVKHAVSWATNIIFPYIAADLNSPDILDEDGIFLVSNVAPVVKIRFDV